MSIRLMTLVWDIPFPTQAQKLIALKLADYAADTGGSVFPSAETLGDKAGCDERTVQRTLKAFRGCGLIHLKREGGKGPKDTNEWWLNVPMMAALAYGKATIVGTSTELEIDGEIVQEKGDTVSPIDDARVTPVQKRVTPVSPKGDASVTQSVNNHQEPSLARERACDEDARAKPAERWIAEFSIKAGESCFGAWIAHLRAKGKDALADVAEVAGEMRVSSKWPKEGSPMPKVARPVKLANVTGEAAQ